MATLNLVRGMGSFVKECGHPESRWPRYPHEYKIRYRNAAGRQTEESGFATQDKAKAPQLQGQPRKHPPAPSCSSGTRRPPPSSSASSYASWASSARATSGPTAHP